MNDNILILYTDDAGIKQHLHLQSLFTKFPDLDDLLTPFAEFPDMSESDWCKWILEECAIYKIEVLNLWFESEKTQWRVIETFIKESQKRVEK